MPKRDDIKSVLVIGSGPIVIGQACEFDYSGSQACRVLKAEGIRVILVNSNPATIMTDPEMADATYIEPITSEVIEQIIQIERPDAVLATLGGQTALNAAMALNEAGVFDKYGVQLIGASISAIRAGESREKFREVVESVGAEVCRSEVCHSLTECEKAAEKFGFPVVIRPSFTMGGAGSGIAYDRQDLVRIAGRGLALSPTTEVLVEESVIGWKEFELELMRDKADNVVVVCGIENFDPMGVHTGDSITVAPPMTLTDREYQHMRDVGIAVIRAVGVDTGGCNIQFAVNPKTGRMVVIELNPRVSRSSALASKATGFPIAKLAAKVALGYTLDEVYNDITGTTKAAFEPTLDYVVVKVPRFAFEKFPEADPTLTTHMKSVGEAMAFGRSFTEALQKALRSLESEGSSFEFDTPGLSASELTRAASSPREGRIRVVQQALLAGASIDELSEATGIDPWFLDQIALINETASQLKVAAPLVPTVPEAASAAALRALKTAKRRGFSDEQIGGIWGWSADRVRALRHLEGVRPVYKTVDTCAGEFPSKTPYLYSTYDQEDESEPSNLKKIIVLGSGPNRIGQGVEFDYSCVHAVQALSSAGFETVMVNCNPETVSTDYDTSDRLYFEPLTVEDVLEVIAAERKAGEVIGVIVAMGGQTPLKLARTLASEGVPILGTSPEAINRAEDRGEFARVLDEANLLAPDYGMASTLTQAKQIAQRIEYPVLLRPSYVLGGRGMEIAYDDAELENYLARATSLDPNSPVLVDKFLESAIEYDIDALFDGVEVYIGGVMEHVEEAGVHSGDSACALPPVSASDSEIEEMVRATTRLAQALGVRGLINVQFARSNSQLFVLEANPRASRTVPFVSKATGVALARAAARIMAGSSIKELREEGLLPQRGDGSTLPKTMPISVKEAVLPFNRFAGVDTTLGPEMKSTGEVMGLAKDFASAFAKAQAGVNGEGLPSKGAALVSLADKDKAAGVAEVKRLKSLGFEVFCTVGTADFMAKNDLDVQIVSKFREKDPKHVSSVDVIEQGLVDLVINTPMGQKARGDGYEIRSAASSRGVAYVTTLRGFQAAVSGIAAQAEGPLPVRSIQAHIAEVGLLSSGSR